MRQNTINTLCVTVYGNAFRTHSRHGYPQGDTGYPRLFVDNLFHGPVAMFHSRDDLVFLDKIRRRKTAPEKCCSTLRDLTHSASTDRREGLSVIIPDFPAGRASAA